MVSLSAKGRYGLLGEDSLGGDGVIDTTMWIGSRMEGRSTGLCERVVLEGKEEPLL
jgi:hypothetical protein